MAAVADCAAGMSVDAFRTHLASWSPRPTRYPENLGDLPTGWALLLHVRRAHLARDALVQPKLGVGVMSGHYWPEYLPRLHSSASRSPSTVQGRGPVAEET
jgi:hypothetical protein